MAAHRCVVVALATARLLHQLWGSLSWHVRRLPIPLTHITLGLSWLVVAPLLVWAIATMYVPLVAPFLGWQEGWGIALVATVLLVASLIGHVLAHLCIARAIRSARPAHIPVYPFGDAAQVWHAAHTPLHEALIALSGPGFNIVAAYVAYRVWDSQLHIYSNIAMPLVAGVNVVAAILNLAPGFPLDGGRLTRAIIWGLLGRPARGTQLGHRLGYAMASALSLWGLVVLSEHARFSEVTGIGTVSIAVLLVWASRRQDDGHNSYLSRQTFSPYSVRGFMSCVLLLGLLAMAASLVPTTHGIRMPGVAIPIEPMITVPDLYRHTPKGSFLMTTVFDQTPIVAGQWVYAHLSSSSDLVAPERIVPPTMTPQERIQYSYQLLEQSENTATVVALRLAGYQTVVRGTIIEVVDIQPGSWASKALQPGDRILRLNGTPLFDSADLFAQLRAHDPATPLDLELVRNSTLLHFHGAFTPVNDGLSEPAFTVRAAEPYTEAPFSVLITPQKIIGGPSVGLMFTLALYNQLIPEDITGGRTIAGTGTIDLDGNVGPIGGVAQKVAAAEAAGADYFLVPAANATEARQVARRIEVIEVATVEQAIELLRNLPPDERQS